MPFLDANGVRLHYRIDGPDDAPVLMLCNSLGTDLAMWDAQMPALRESFRVLRYDTRGHGESEVTQGPYSIAELAQDAIALLDALHIDRANFCGLSMGGMTGLWLGINAPQRLGRLVLCNTGAKIGTPELWNARIEAVQKGGMASIVTGVLSRWFTPRFVEAEPAVIARTRQMLMDTAPEGYAACCAAIRDADLRGGTALVSAPTLVISGTQDQATPPADGRFLAQKIRNARYVEFDVGHLSNIEAADLFTDAVLQFLRG